MRFYINGTLVLTVTDPSLTSGRVGIGMYRSADSTGDELLVDWATLSTYGTTGSRGPVAAKAPTVQQGNRLTGGNEDISP